MTDEARKALQERNQFRAITCRQCNARSVVVVDGDKIGGLSGLQYRYCPGCGWSTPVKARHKA